TSARFFVRDLMRILQKRRRESAGAHLRGAPYVVGKSSGATSSRYFRHTLQVCAPPLSWNVWVTPAFFSRSENSLFGSNRPSSLPQPNQSSLRLVLSFFASPRTSLKLSAACPRGTAPLKLATRLKASRCRKPIFNAWPP